MNFRKISIICFVCALFCLSVTVQPNILRVEDTTEGTQEENAADDSTTGSDTSETENTTSDENANEPSDETNQVNTIPTTGENVADGDSSSSDDENDSGKKAREESQKLIPEAQESLKRLGERMSRSVGGVTYNTTWTGSQGSRQFYDANGKRWGTGNTLRVIDVSEHNGKINWDAIKNSKEVDAVIVRIGWAWDGTDEQAQYNISELNRLKIPYGIYLYSYAKNSTDATNEATHLKKLMKQFNASPSLPIYYDIEYWPNGGYKDQGNWIACPTTQAEYMSIIPTFLKNMQNAGYARTNVYSYRSYLQNQLNNPEILKYVSWVAVYGPQLGYTNNNYKGDILGWQYTSGGNVGGVFTGDVSAFYSYYGYDTQNTVGATTGKLSTEPTLSYQGKSQSIGWLDKVSELNTAGTTGRSRALYNLKISLENVPASTHLYGTVVSGSGTKNYDLITSSTVLGTDGSPMQRVSFSLNNINGYKLYYRVHESGKGWRDWVAQGNYAGTAGYSIEAIEFKLVADSSVIDETPKLWYNAHVAERGWLGSQPSSTQAGNAGSNYRLEAMKIGIENVPTYSITVKAHIQNVGWVNYNNVNSSTIIGTTGKKQRIEALSFDLNGISGYKLQYQVHIQGYGWTTWHDENQVVGSAGASRLIDSLNIRLVNEQTNVIDPSISYQAHVQDIGWTGIGGSESIAGTQGRKLRVEAFRLMLNNVPATAQLTGKLHIQNLGWVNYSDFSKMKMIGTQGKSLRIEAVNFNMTGVPGYKLQYRTHIQDIGWSNWIDHGNQSGTTGRSKRLEAIQFRLVKI